MLSKTKVKHIHSLRRKKNRQQQGFYLAEGDKLVRDLLHHNAGVTELFALQPWLDHNYDKIRQNRITVENISERELKAISSLSTPNQVVAIVRLPENAFKTGDPLPGDSLFLGLETIQDPGNMGTLIRTADWFGIRHIFCSPDCVDAFNPKVVQATMGSIARVQVHTVDLAGFIQHYSNTLAVYAAALGGGNLYKTRFRTPAMILIGNEARGLSKELLHLKEPEKVMIPKYGGAESLNASMAAGIILSHLRSLQS